MKITVKATAVLLALTLLLTGCASADFREGYWAQREDVPFVTAFELGFYVAQEEKLIPCTVEFSDGWEGPEAPDEDILVSKEHAFTAAGYLDILEPHEGTKPEDIYETAFIFYLIYNRSTKQIAAAGGYMDEGIDDFIGGIDSQTAAMFIDYFYTQYDSYVSEYGAVD